MHECLWWKGGSSSTQGARICSCLQEWLSSWPDLRCRCTKKNIDAFTNGNAESIGFVSQFILNLDTNLRLTSMDRSLVCIIHIIHFPWYTNWCIKLNWNINWYTNWKGHHMWYIFNETEMHKKQLLEKKLDTMKSLPMVHVALQVRMDMGHIFNETEMPTKQQLKKTVYRLLFRFEEMTGLTYSEC